MATKKTRVATPEYLSELRVKSSEVFTKLTAAKKDLFQITATAKLFNPEFEEKRKKCTDLTKDFLSIQDEIERVEKILS